jgi:hypothetical protein
MLVGSGNGGQPSNEWIERLGRREASQGRVIQTAVDAARETSRASWDGVRSANRWTKMGPDTS